jgi:hypothetical protein
VRMRKEHVPWNCDKRSNELYSIVAKEQFRYYSVGTVNNSEQVLSTTKNNSNVEWSMSLGQLGLTITLSAVKKGTIVNCIYANG